MRKITIKLNAVNWDLLNEIAELIGLRRDAYLAKVLPGELKEIRRQSWANDQAGERYVRKFPEFFASTSKQVSIMLPEDVADQIDSVAEEKRVPRDCLLDAIVKFIAFRILPSALALSAPRKTLQYKTEKNLLTKVMGRLPIESIDDYFEVLSPEFYRTELHYTAESIQEIEATMKELRSSARALQRKASGA